MCVKNWRVCSWGECIYILHLVCIGRMSSGCVSSLWVWYESPLFSGVSRFQFNISVVVCWAGKCVQSVCVVIIGGFLMFRF